MVVCRVENLSVPRSIVFPRYVVVTRTDMSSMARVVEGDGVKPGQSSDTTGLPMGFAINRVQVPNPPLFSGGVQRTLVILWSIFTKYCL